MTDVSSPPLPALPTAADPPAGSPPILHAPETLNFDFVQRPGLLKIAIVNFLLGIVTLGFYRFWGKTRVRKHIWSSVHINGEPLEYTGTGMELFKGFLVVLGAIFLPFAVIIGTITIVDGPESPWIIVVQMIGVILAQVFWGYALYKARKFQLSRTNWRGIRGTLAGSAMKYSLTYFGALLARGASMGWATPVMNTLLQEQIIGDMRFGDAAFKFKGRAGPLYPTYAMCWFLTLLAVIFFPMVLWSLIDGWFGADIKAAFDWMFRGEDESIPFPESGLWSIWTVVAILAFGFLVVSLIVPMLWAIYSAKELRTFGDYTRFDGAQFKLDATAGSIIWLVIVNLLIVVFTLGIGTPFAQRRLVKYVIDRLSLQGAIDIDRIAQSRVPMESRGEGLADAFDVGGI